jgi:hypothetical protein
MLEQRQVDVAIVDYGDPVHGPLSVSLQQKCQYNLAACKGQCSANTLRQPVTMDSKAANRP